MSDKTKTKDDNDSLSKAFDALIPEKENPVFLAPFNHLRIVISPLYRQGYHYDCKNDNKYAQLIFNALAQAYFDVQANPEKYYKTKLETFSNGIIAFIPWLNQHEATELNRYKILKSFEVYRLNELKLKSSLLNVVLKMLELAISIASLDDNEKSYLSTLIKGTTVSYNDEHKQQTLTAFFGECQWLRPIVGDETFNRLESPKRLMNSFIVTIASTLSILQKTHTELETYFIEHKICVEDLKLKNKSSKKITNVSKTGALLLTLICRCSNDGFADEMSELLFNDIVIPRYKSLVKQFLINGEPIPYRASGKFDSARGLTCRTPVFFDEQNVQLIAQRAEYQWRNNKKQSAVPIPVTKVENILFSFLCAWLTIPQSDIFKITENDFRFMLNNSGAVTHLLCDYYKGRARTFRETDTVSTRQIEGKAILSFIQKRKSCPLPDNNLIEKLPETVNCSEDSLYGRIFSLWSGVRVNSIIKTELQQRQYTPIFITTITALLKNHGQVYSKWRSNNKELKSSDYLTLSKNPVSTYWFSLNSIKNTAVHSKTDNYRDGHLVNTNSHTNNTEKTSYLTQENKEWVNQHGRITRLVMLDIADNVFRPSMDNVIKHTKDMQLRTEIITSTDGKVNEIGIVEESPQNHNYLTDTLLVIDSVETVCIFIHFIAQAEEKYKRLLTENLEFVEKTMLPTAEWMAELLASKLSKKNIKEGEKIYKKSAQHFPSLFDAQLIG